MKRYITIIVGLMTWLMGYGQDIIMMSNGQKIEARVDMIRDGKVEYKKFSNPNGPTYVESKENIKLIKYMNGDVDIFGEVEVSDTDEVETKADTAAVEDLYVVPTKVGILRYDRHSPSYVTLDRNVLSVERAYEVMGDRYDDFTRHMWKWKNWKKCWLIGVGVTAVVTPMLAVGARKTNAKGLDMATIFVPVGGMTAIVLGAAKSSKHKHRMRMRLGAIEY